jgi:hypothetical protein
MGKEPTCPCDILFPPSYILAVLEGACAGES